MSEHYASLAEQFDTPLFVYEANLIETAVHAYAPQKGNTLVAYAMKANNNPHILQLLQRGGMGADVTSGGELFLALQAGFAPEKIIYSGVGKTAAELSMALDAGIKAIHIESEMEWELLAQLATTRQQIVPISVRLNPNIFAKTHPYISTGQASSKFGVEPETAVSLYHKSTTHPFMAPVGVAAHIGSQIADFKAYESTAVYLAQFAQRLTQEGVPLRYVDVGGGLAIDYTNDMRLPDIEAWVTAVSTPVQQAGFELVMEPGRSIIGPSGTLLTRVLYIKQRPNRQIVVVDAAMNDLIRPTLYQAKHPIGLVGERIGPKVTVDVVGPICESGDWLAKDVQLPPLQQGDLLAIHQAGAYVYAMGSNYNGRLRPAEILLQEGKPRLIRHRQTHNDLLSGVPYSPPGSHNFPP